MGLYINARQSTVIRIYLVGHREMGLTLARTLYARCRPLGHAPYFIPAQRLTKKLRRQLLNPVCPTCVMPFGEHAAEDYDSLLDVHPWIKVLRLVPPDAPKPKIFFSWHEQTFFFPRQHLQAFPVNALKGHAVHPMYYLLKPVDSHALEETLVREWEVNRGSRVMLFRQRGKPCFCRRTISAT